MTSARIRAPTRWLLYDGNQSELKGRRKATSVRACSGTAPRAWHTDDLRPSLTRRLDQQRPARRGFAQNADNLKSLWA